VYTHATASKQLYTAVLVYTAVHTTLYFSTKFSSATVLKNDWDHHMLIISFDSVKLTTSIPYAVPYPDRTVR